MKDSGFYFVHFNSLMRRRRRCVFLLCTKLLSLTSAFALALLTDRILIAHGALTDEFVAPFHYGWMGTHPAFYLTDVVDLKLYGVMPNSEFEKLLCGDPLAITAKSWVRDVIIVCKVFNCHFF